MDSAYIDDGFNRPGYIKADDASATGNRKWEALKITYRVASRIENVEFDGQRADIKAREGATETEKAIAEDRHYCDYVVKRLKSWDLKNRGGHSVPINAESLSRIVPGLFFRIYSMIRGVDFGDPEPPKETVDTEADQVKN
jgi:hypothetical protein